MERGAQKELAGQEYVRGLAVRYREPLLRYFARRGLSPDAAEDCAQETFARLARADHSAIEGPEPYLFTIASNVVVDRARRAKSREEMAHDPIDGLDFASEAPSPARVLEGKEAIARFVEALNELPPRTREILLLNRMEDLTFTQLAARYGISVSAIEKHMARAMRHLRSRLKGD